MCHNTLKNYYMNAFNMTYLHRFCTLTELENMVPFELDVYNSMIQQRIAERDEEAILQASIAEAANNRRF